MEIPNCKDCEKLRVKLHHNCLKHCKCFEKFTWNPSDCSDCLLLFELAEVTSLPNEASVILCQLGKKMQNLARGLASSSWNYFCFFQCLRFL